jgi:SNF2 family DNA or RNA helicase
LVFTRYRHTLAFASQALREAGVPHVVFHGGLTSAEKRDAFEAFRGGSRVMVATDVGGEGQNLQFCHLLVNFDLPWNPMTVEQRIGRLHRMGQQCEVRVFNLCSAGTIEQRILAVIDQRLHLFELVVGEMDLVLGNLTDDRDLEERLLQVCARDDDAVAAELERVAGEIERARGRFEQTRTFDAALFGRDFEA